MYGQIYSLSDPRDGSLRYVGQTVRTLSRRLQGHLSPSELSMPSHKARWLTQLARVGIRPVIAKLDEADSQDVLNAKEIWWIHYLSSNGYQLTNMAEGGDASGGVPWSEETREKIKRIRETNGYPRSKHLDIKQILQMAADGLTADQIAKKLSVTFCTIYKNVQRYKEESGLKVTFKPAYMAGTTHYEYRADVTHDKLLELRDQGLTYVEIGRVVGLSSGTVGKRLKKENPVYRNKNQRVADGVSYTSKRLSEGANRHQIAKELGKDESTIRFYIKLIPEDPNV